MDSATNYYVNNTPQPASRDHEVHKDGCFWLTRAKDITWLGLFSTCDEAVLKAKDIYPKTANGCAVCSPRCNTG